MGFGRRFKGLGKFAKKAAGGLIKLAATNVPGGGTVAGIVQSKLQSRGEDRRKTILANKTLAAAKKPNIRDGLRRAVSIGPSKTAVQEKPNASPLIAIKAAQAPGLMSSKDIDRLTDTTVGKKRQRRATSVKMRLEKAAKADKTIVKLTAGQRQVLADEFKAGGGGTPAEFRRFIEDNT
jgi:hypothetical protein